MSPNDRARQFLPFDALKGLKEALRLKEYEHERMKKTDLSEDKIAYISDTLFNINKGDIVYVKYFFDGYYKEIKGSIKLKLDVNIIEVDKTKISLDDLYDIKVIKKFGD